MTDTASGTGTGTDRGDDDGWPGLSCLAEEMAEFGTVIGEITGGGRRDVILRERLIARLGALRAAIDFTVTRNALDWQAVNQRRDRQRARYESLYARAPQSPGT